jgi:UDP-glucose 4-epimerase
VSGPRVLVTGAGGFIGGAVVEHLHQSGAQNVRAGVSRLPSTARVARLPIEIVACDLFDPETLGAALKGVDAVIHCASTGDDNRTVDGTRRLLEQARAAGARKFVHLSSVAVYGDAEGLVNENTSAVGRLSPYARGKLASEADCRLIASPDMAVAVLRPALVYGPHSDLWTTPYIARLISGRWRRLGAAGEGRANLVHVDDVAAFAGFLTTHETGVFSVFNANGPDVPTWNAYLDLFSDTLGAPRPTGRQSTSLAWAALRRPLKVLEKRLLKMRPVLTQNAGVLGQLFRAIQDDVILNPSYQELALYRLNAVYAMEAAAVIGFRPATGLQQGLAQCAAWARESGLA